jgi:hypothetical protein
VKINNSRINIKIFTQFGRQPPSHLGDEGGNKSGQLKEAPWGINPRKRRDNTAGVD